MPGAVCHTYFLQPINNATADRLLVNHYIVKFTQSLNHAIAMSLKRNPHSPNSQFVRAVILVKGVHFYGFHSKYSPFLKILIVDPAYTNRAAMILQSGIVMKTGFRVFENHLSFVLQFLSDFGLYGCGWIDLSSNIWQRGQEDEKQDDVDNAEISCKPSSYHRQTRMSLELDVEPHDILNRLRLIARNIHHKLRFPAAPQPPEPLVISVRELWEDERRRRVARGLPPSPDIPRDLSEGSRSKGGEWVAEARWWEEIEKRIAREREASPENDQAEDGEEWTKWIMTTFESVEALWDARHRTWRPANQANQAEGPVQINPYDPSASAQGTGAHQAQTAGVDSDVDVDESLLAGHELTSLIEREEIEAVQQQKEHDEDTDIAWHEEANEDIPPEDIDASPAYTIDE